MDETIKNEGFDLINGADLTVSFSATHLGVTKATIKNWVNSGDLKSNAPGYITKESLLYFKEQVAGRERLTHRANKSKKDSHDHIEVQSRFSQLLKNKQNKQNKLDSIGEEYQKGLSNAYQNQEGIYYTPIDIVNHLLSQPERDLSNATFCDPCCGSGNFILRALELGFKPENVFGYDIDPIAVKITKARVKQFTGVSTNNIKEADFLMKVQTRSAKKFDFIYTNPPWGKKTAKKERDALATQLDSGNSKDTCSLFFFSCLKSLNTNGQLGLLLPESFFNIASFECAREKASQYKMTKLIDYGKAFSGLITKAQAIILENTPARSVDKVVCQNYNRGKIENDIRLSSSFCMNPKFILNLQCKSTEANTLQHIFNLPYITLKHRAKWALGIVTGNNKKFIKSEMQPGYIPVYKGLDLIETKLMKPKNFIPSDLSLYQQVAPQEVYQAEDKLLYRFISSKLCFHYDTKQCYTLNSLNIIIPDSKFPVNTCVISELLNSDFMNWIFFNIFNTHKILRSDLESLPIYSQFLQGVTSFDEKDYISCLNIEKLEDGNYRVIGE